jgi:hypothetical protein
LLVEDAVPIAANDTDDDDHDHQIKDRHDITNSHNVIDTTNNNTDISYDDEEIREALDFKKSCGNNKKGNNDDSSDDDSSVGQQPLVPFSNAANDGMNGIGSNAANKANKYGKALLPGEGQMLAQYVQQNQRIPRRVEIGYECEEIEKLENSGYVTSGSRHARMNAVRIRKENQIYTVEEQRALALITMEEKKQQETTLLEEFFIMLQNKEKQKQKQSESQQQQQRK